MALIETGRTCVIVKGADAGKTAVIKSITDKNFVIITGEHVKERKINVKHIEPLNASAEVPAGKKIEKTERKAQTKAAPVKKAAPKAKAEKKAAPIAAKKA